MQIELGDVRSHVHTVKVKNRLDCCYKRLTQMEIRVGYYKVTKENQDKDTISKNKKCGEQLTVYWGILKELEGIWVQCESPIRGNYITIQTQDSSNKIINMAEVDVIGKILGKKKTFRGKCI